MQGASREANAALRARFDGWAAKAGPADLSTVGDELAAVVALLGREPALRRHLGDSSTPEQARTDLLGSLLRGKVAKPTMDLLQPAVSARWTSAADLVGSLEQLSRLAVLAQAERDGSLDDVEDELFRFGRILDGQTRLRSALGNTAEPVERRTALLDSLLDGKVKPATATLLRQLVAAPRGRSLERAVDELVKLAAERRERYIAYVRAAAPLSAAQQERLTASLNRIYGRQISLRVEVEPGLIGGLVVRVGDEVIDGSIEGRLARAKQRLSG